MLEKCCHDIDLYQGACRLPAETGGSFGGRKIFVPENMPTKAGINDLDVYHRKPTGRESVRQGADGDGDIIDFQTALVEYFGGENLCLPHQPATCPTITGFHGDRRRMAWPRATSCAIFWSLHDAHTSERIVDKRYETRDLRALRRR